MASHSLIIAWDASTANPQLMLNSIQPVIRKNFSHHALFQNAVVPSCGKWRWWCQVFVCEHGEGGGNGTDDPEGADQIFEHVLEDKIMHGKDEDGERTGEGKSPGSPGWNQAQSA